MNPRIASSSLAMLLVLLSVPAAHAQSSTGSAQIYGTIDAAVGSFKASGGARTTQLASGNLTTNYLGYRAREDLGGGLYASMTLESYFRGDTGDAGRYTGDTFFSRASNVGLGGDFGLVRLGRVGTPLFTNTLVYNPLAASFGFSPVIRNIFGAAARVAGDSGWNNAVAYNTPNWAGFSGSLMYALAEAAEGANASGALQYSAGAFSIGVVGQQVKVPFKSGEENTWQLGSSYDFGLLKLFGQYTDVRETQTQTTVAGTHDEIAQLGVSVPVGAGALLASWSESRTSGSARFDRSFATVGYAYRLSRRTDLYAMWMVDKLTGNDAASSVAFGVRHAF